jgi:hypothetical protein
MLLLLLLLLLLLHVVAFVAVVAVVCFFCSRFPLNFDHFSYQLFGKADTDFHSTRRF